MPHFSAVHPGDYDTQIQTQTTFLYSAPTREISSSCVYSFGCYPVDKHSMLTDKRMPLKTSSLRYAMHSVPAEDNFSIILCTENDVSPG